MQGSVLESRSDASSESVPCPVCGALSDEPTRADWNCVRCGFALRGTAMDGIQLSRASLATAMARVVAQHS
ncbi:hypothetical protein BC830DRAFT_1111427 [Chytriomyces sp. MP71]|nr:hypothetical protein BC830DRAFT_1111427 [Chytriomyces sp. MP71]